MRIVVTGSDGFLGREIVKKLRKLEHEVIELDILNGFDITKWEHIKKIKQFEVLIHLAAKTYVPDSYKIPQEMYHLNFIGTLNALELCRINNAKMIFTSSYVYGLPQYLPIDEKHPTDSFNPYCHSKLLGEDLCISYNKFFEVPIIIFRPFNIYGKGQNGAFLIPLIKKQINENGKIFLKDSKPKRDFVYVDDVVNAFCKGVEYNSSKYEIFNIGSGMSYSIKEISELMVAKSNREIQIEFSEEKRHNEVMDTIAKIKKAEILLGWRPLIDIETGLELTINLLDTK